MSTRLAGAGRGGDYVQGDNDAMTIFDPPGAACTLFFFFTECNIPLLVLFKVVEFSALKWKWFI
jgi:hypothetical protein